MSCRRRRRIHLLRVCLARIRILSQTAIAPRRLRQARPPHCNRATKQHIATPLPSHHPCSSIDWIRSDRNPGSTGRPGRPMRGIRVHGTKTPTLLVLHNHHRCAPSETCARGEGRRSTVCNQQLLQHRGTTLAETPSDRDVALSQSAGHPRGCQGSVRSVELDAVALHTVRVALAMRHHRPGTQR